MDDKIAQAVEQWLNDSAIDDADKQEIRELKSAGDEKALKDRFYQDLEFGTGGMRGIIGAGINRINVYTVGAATQGLANYVLAQGEDAAKKGVAIAFDSRRMSEEFARRTACVLAGNGIKAYLFDALRPTPELSFAVRHLACTAGIVITASHNPAEYNGYKVYWSDGVQVVPPHDKRIIEEVRNVGAFSNVKTMAYDEACSQGLIKLIGRDIDQVFLEHVHLTCLRPDSCKRQGDKLKIVFTGLHGTGSVLVPEALCERGFYQVIEVPEQREPDGDFPTVESPNPEETAALTMGIELARNKCADLVIGTDPDADRVGIAVRGPTGEYELLTGNQTGALLTYYICEEMTRTQKFPANAVMITTIVSSDLMKTIARSYGAEVIETLTGFKWIGSKVEQFEQDKQAGKPSKDYIFGAEESYGYMPGMFTRDKDAVTSAACIADLAAVTAERDMTLFDLLQELFKRFGYFQEGTKSLVLPGADGAAKIQQMMERFRKQPPKSIGDITVDTMTDLMSGEKRSLKNDSVVGQVDLPASNVICFELADRTKVIVRPSGTEPKIKFYVLTREAAEDLQRARRVATKRIETILDDLIANGQGE
jgi:phosphoglucomutase